MKDYAYNWERERYLKRQERLPDWGYDLNHPRDIHHRILDRLISNRDMEVATWYLLNVAFDYVNEMGLENMFAVALYKTMKEGGF